MAKSVGLKNKMIADYLGGSLSLGERLPSTRQLAKKYQTSVATVSKVIEILAAEGRVSKRTGGGAYVNDTNQLPDRPRIGFVVHSLADAIGPKVMQGVEYIAKNNNFVLEVADSNFNIEDERQHIKSMAERGIDGIVLYPVVNLSQKPTYLKKEFRNIPILVVDMYSPEMDRPHIIFDNYTAGREMVSYFVSLGKKRISFLIPDKLKSYLSVKQRFNGYMRSLSEHKLEYDKNLCPSFQLGLSTATINVDSLIEAVHELMSLEQRPDAILTPDDFAALHVINELKLNFPSDTDEIDVAGFDNDFFATRIAMLASHGRLKVWKTTNPDFVRMGERAAEMLVDIINQNSTSSSKEIVLPCPLYSFRHNDSTLSERPLKLKLG